ncbi:thiamine pyrophosphate-binding protein [Thermobifida halotolerans]|uniref:Thiamine pyrophosphate-binding protein n=1 Tax=Thermobifida halotolerans TaxID=483545 RepID=A0A399G688_9ACTN|nr:thiamine pyrophosphate-dependent enzyme [Thermobifida halotolerans]UOE20943.1 thiamine pyrophosphate-binding protein [Thermobifida halotolerans]
MSHHLDGGDAVVAAFGAIGADYIFSSPGSEWAPVWESLARHHRDHLPCPKYLDLTHETVAVGMATGYSLLTRRAQGVLLHAGPGLLQGACAIHGALLAGAPMVIASSESTTYGDGTGPDPGGQWYRNLSVVGGPHTMAQPFVKWANQAASVSTLFTMVTRSAEMAGRAPSGPVYLNVPLEVLLEPWEERATAPTAPKGSTVSSPEEIAAVLDLLAEAENPVIVTESTGREADGMRALVGFAEALQIPVVEPNSTVCANFPRNHELHAGDSIDPFMDTADLILLVNCRSPFYPPSRRPARARIVVVDEVPQRPHIAYQVLYADHYLEGGVAATLREMTRLVRENPPEAALLERRRAAQLTRRAAETAAIEAAEQRAAGADGIDPVHLVAALRELFADDDPIVVDETITHGGLVRRHMRRSTPDSYLYVQGGLGQGIAWALGARLAAPERPVVLTVGDGAFQYNPVIQSLDAARAYGLPLLVVVFNNHQYRSMKMNHLRFYPEGAAVETGEFLGVDLSGQPELSAFAEPFGMHAESVAHADDLTPALSRALKAVREGTTAVVNVSVTR